MNYLFLSGDNVATVNEALVPHFMGLQQEALLKMADVLGKAVKDSVQVDIDQLYDFRDEIIGPGGADIVGITDLGGFYTGTTVEDALQELGADLSTAWGEVSGTLSNQTDLQAALNAKLDDSQLSAFGATLIDDANASAARTTLELGTAATAAATSFQPSDATLTALAGLAPSANQGIYATGSDSFSTYTLSAFARTILDDADGPAVRATIGAGTGNGTITSIGVTTANGVSGSSSGGTTPSLTITLGAITPSSVSATGSITAGSFIASTGPAAVLQFENRSGTARTYSLYADANIVRINGNIVGDLWTINESGNVTAAGTMSDLYGNVRSVPITDQNATYTFTASDRGRARRKTNTTAYTYTVEAVHSTGDVLTAVNNNGTGNLTIAQGAGVTLRLAGTATTGNRTVGPHGYATIYMQSATEGYVSGPGVT